MRGRGQLMGTVVVVALVVGVGLVLQRAVGVHALAGPPGSAAPSGAWFCPHGGGRDWQTTLHIANPGRARTQIRVTQLSDGRAGEPRGYPVAAGSQLVLPEDTTSRSSATMIEYFGGWVAAGWVSHASGAERGVAAEPCAPAAGTSWLLPDGSTELAQQATRSEQQRTLDSYVVVMNPFATDAIVSVSLYTDKDPPVHPGDWTRTVIKPYQSRAFFLNHARKGFATVSAVVDASVGRVVASSVDVNEAGGIRASLGQSSPSPSVAVLPGGFDQGRTELVAMNPTSSEARLQGTMLGRAEPIPLALENGGRVNVKAAETFPMTTEGPSGVAVRVPSGDAVVRRTFGQASDQAATGPGVPAGAWVILPAVAGPPSHPGLVLANPGPNPITVTVSSLAPVGATGPPPVTVQVPGLRVAAAPSDFLAAAPDGAILATAREGTFVPAAASYSLGKEGYATYAVALGVPIPDTWVRTEP